MAESVSPFFKPLNCTPPVPSLGTVSLLSPSITALSDSVLSTHPAIPRNPHPAHITLLSKDEYRAYTSNPSKTPFEAIDTSKIYPVGVSQRKHVWFIPVLWNAANIWRTKNGFNIKDFHITLSSHDAHDIDKSPSTVLPTEQTTNINNTPIPPALDLDPLDQLFLSSHLRNDPPEVQLQWATHLIHSHPTSERGYLRLADLSYTQPWPKLAMLSYHAALMRSDSEPRRAYYTRKLTSCLESTEFGPLLTEAEATHLTSTLPADLLHTLTAPWPPLPLPEVHLTRPTLPRTQYHTLNPAYKLPRFFSWIIPCHLAAMSTPRTAADITALSALSIPHILTLSEPLPPSWFPTSTNTFIPVPNYHPPTTHQTDHALHLILSSPATLVHCGGGKGRAGTILACYLALFGFTPPSTPTFGTGPPKMAAKAAVEILRKIRPGSIETERQERFVDAYVALAWKRYSRGEALIGGIAEPAGERLDVSGVVDGAETVVLVGVQGSGKSSFARMCKARNSNVVVNEALRLRRNKVLIVDRCNATIAERKEWAVGRTVAVWFDYDTELCTSRAETRSTHETLPSYLARAAITSMALLLEPPTLQEGFTGVVRVRGFDNARELADLLFGVPAMKKFIRTRHLLDLGSATRDDLVVSREDLHTRFNTPVIVEEKVDGANIGFSLSNDEIRVQNRSHYISSSDQAQFAKLDMWLERRAGSLRRVLGRDPAVQERYVLYGEWLAATHSIPYDRLSDYFLAFDLYDRVQDRFAGRDELRGLLSGSGIKVVPEIYRGVLEGEEMLLGFLERESMFASGVRVEGVVVRWEESGERGKVVRSDFIEGGRHWSKNEYRKNGLARDVESEEGE